MPDGFGSGDSHVTYLSPEAFDKLLEAIENPKRPTQALIALMRAKVAAKYTKTLAYLAKNNG